MEAWITDQELQEALKIVNTAIEQRLSFDYKTSTLNFLETMSPKFSARFKRYAVPICRICTCINQVCSRQSISPS